MCAAFHGRAEERVNEQVKFGAEHYGLKSQTTSSVLAKLWGKYKLEGLNMPYTMEQFQEELKQEYLESLTSEEKIKLSQSLSSDERAKLLQSLPSDERAKLLQSLSLKERLHGLGPEQVLKEFSADELKAYIAKLEEKQNGEKKN